MEKSYIGITDFTSSDQVYKMLDVLKDSTERLLMVGIMMSRKTLNNIPTKWKDAWPAKEEVKNIFVRHPRVFNTLHYADFDGIDILENLESATTYGGENMDAIQLDMIWPDPNEIKAYHKAYPHIQIVLQINSKSLDLINNDPYMLIDMLTGYEDSISYVLLDKSMGRGKGMNAQALKPFVHIVSKYLPGIGIAVAGGLGPDTLDLVKPISEDFSNISIDAQGKLRPSGNALDPIDWEMAERYLERALAML